jgi:hypothetical protein
MNTNHAHREWFSFSNDFGFETYETEEEARKSAEDALWEYRNDAADEGWSDEVHSIKIGRVTDWVIETERKKCTPEDGSDWDELVDYGISQSQDGRLINAAPDLLAACMEFVRKVDCGEARSTASAKQMRAAIAKATGGEAP